MKCMYNLYCTYTMNFNETKQRASSSKVKVDFDIYQGCQLQKSRFDHEIVIQVCLLRLAISKVNICN